jgi:hypothetical protein
VFVNSFSLKMKVVESKSRNLLDDDRPENCLRVSAAHIRLNTESLVANSGKLLSDVLPSFKVKVKS